MKMRLSVAGILLLAATLSQNHPVDAFQFRTGSSVATSRSSCSITSRLFSLISKSQQADVVAAPLKNGMDASVSSSKKNLDKVNVEASKWKAEAEKIRREAAKLDSDLTSQKIATLERKLANQSWLERNPDQVADLEQQLESLRNKLAGKEPIAAAATTAPSSTSKGMSVTKEKTAIEPSPTPQKKEFSSTSSTEKKKKQEVDKARRIEENPLCGYDQADLDLYVPVVMALEERMPQNATLAEKLDAFRQAPELQEHFQEKIRKMLVEPMEEMMKLEQLKKDYLSSSSSVERKQLRREIDQLEKGVEDEGPFLYSDSVVLNDLPVLEEEEIQQRLEAVGALHPILQALYKKRCGIDEMGDLRLAIEMDHYEPQLQLLEQVRYLEPITNEVRHEIRLAILSLPMSVRNQFAQGLGLDDGEDVTAIIEALVDGEGEQWMSLNQLVVSTNGGDWGDGSTNLDLPEYNDLDFMDRSRYVKEFLPSLERMEMIHPSMEDVETLMKEVLDKKAYMVTSAPERVIGGYYIRGHNMLSDPETGSTDDLTEFLQERLQKSSLKDKIDLFYIQDPAPPTDEEYEMGETDRPVLLVTAKNRGQLYNLGDPATKTAVSLLGLCSVIIFAAATTQMQPLMRDQVEAAAAGDLSIDISPILSSATQVFASLMVIQTAHELGHRIIAWRDKFEIGLPTLIPSIQIGLQGAITPFKTPPPSNKSMFDFAMAGPLAGLLVSFGLFIFGLDITASMDIDSAHLLPAFPVSFLRSSELCGGMIEFFVGKGALMSSAADAVLPLHPFAIAGFAGIISNSLALLPLGNTDGGRISQVMFGRRGAYLVKIFLTLVLCAMGIFGLDEPRTFLTYVLFTMIWQRDLESPPLNEADELDFNRGLVGIGSAIIVTLALLPML